MTFTERRRFARLNLPILSRPAGVLGPRRPALDLGVGGIRVYVDDPPRLGTRLEIELFMPAGESLSLDVRVAWSQPTESGAPAPYEVGLEFLEMDDVQRVLVERCLAEHGEDRPG